MKYLVILTLALLPLQFAAAQDADEGVQTGKAKIITSNPRPSQCIAAIEINKIDGQEVLVNTQYIEVDAGEHSIRGRAPFVDTSFCRSSGNPSVIYPDELVHTFEAGKTYWVGLDHKPYRQRDWRFVVWKEE